MNRLITKSKLSNMKILNDSEITADLIGKSFEVLETEQFDLNVGETFTIEGWIHTINTQLLGLG